MKRLPSVVALALVLVGAASGPAVAGGYFYSEMGARAASMGTAFAVAGDDLTTLFYNPAALTNLEGTRIDLGVADMLADVTFQRQHERLGPFPAVENIGGDNFIPHVLVGSDFGTRSIYLAGGLFAPFGPAFEYPDNGPQRYNVIDPYATMVYFSGGIGIRATDRLRVGVAFDLVQFENRQSLVFTLDPQGNESPELDGPLELDAGGRAFTWQAGFIYDLSETWSVGLAYHSTIKPTFEGTVEGRIPILGWPGKDDVSINVEVPRMVRAGVAYRGARLTTEFNLVWAQWSIADGLLIDLKNNAFTLFPLEDIEMKQGFDDTFSPRLGIAYRVVPEWLTLRMGLWFEQGAVPSETASVASVDNDKIGIAPGVGFKLMDGRLGVDVTYLMLEIADREITNSKLTSINPLGGPQTVVGNGRLDASMSVMALAFTWAL